MMATRAKLATVEDALNELPDDTLHSAMARAFAEIDAATKDATNPHFKSKYADLSSVIAAIKPALVNNGLFFSQCPIPAEDGVSVETFVYHRRGDFLSLGTVYVPANKRDAQGFGSALTYAKRYGLQTGFGVPTEDDDGNAAVATSRPTQGAARPDNSADGNPTTGEPTARKTKLDGPYDTEPKLEKAAREFARTLRSMGSLEEFDDWRQDSEVKAFVEQCKRDLPGWWFAGHADCPPDFVPLSVEVANTKRGLIELAEINARTNANGL